MMLHRVRMVVNLIYIQGIWVRLRGHETEYVRSEMSAAEIEQKYRSHRPEIVEIEVVPISFDEFRRLSIAEARRQGMGRYCEQHVDFNEVYYRSNLLCDPIKEMADTLRFSHSEH